MRSTSGAFASTRATRSGSRRSARTTSRPCRMERARNRRSEEHTSELQSQSNLVCRLLLEKKKKTIRYPVFCNTLDARHSYRDPCLLLDSIHSVALLNLTATAAPPRYRYRYIHFRGERYLL